MSIIDKLIIHQNTIDYISEERYEKEMGGYIKTAESFAMMSCPSVYIYDFYQRKCVYVSDNPLFLCEHSVEEIKEMGLKYVENFVPEEEQKMLIEMNKAFFNFLDANVPVNDRCKVYSMCDFHISFKDKKILVNQKSCPLALTDDGKVWLLLCIVSFSPHREVGNIELHFHGEKHFWKYSLDSHDWVEAELKLLTTIERTVLMLAIQGKGSYEIAKEMGLSENTVKFHRRSILRKCMAGSLMEAYVNAVMQKMWC